ncbi:response regulator transcription factor [Desulfobacula sp.]|uniref:helix-turn-helix transcriptional regulator n=1 Tax=Desulfobacula sp. TaxID=2593537 RepID=UPI0025BD65F3|nr:response regulator transcription factor [Desulfobacula sp.]MBC2703939.1 response regulator transcription factor [Desulfobacula sp.]
MLIVYSGDETLVELCMDLFVKEDTVKQLSGKNNLNSLQITGKDILIIDFEFCREKDLPQIICPALVLVTVPVNAQAMRLLRRGIRAYGNRHMHEENLRQAVSALKAGQIWLPPAIINRMITALPSNKNEKKDDTWLKELSSREAEVAKWLVNGLSNREISEKMFISIRTVKAHLTSIFKKTGCHNRLELATRMK